MTNSKGLIAYFSRKGNNYVEGSIVNLPIGNTEVITKKIQELTGSGLGHSVKDIKKLCPGSSVLEGLAIKGSTVNGTQNDLSAWLHRHGISDKK